MVGRTPGRSGERIEDNAMARQFESQDEVQQFRGAIGAYGERVQKLKEATDHLEQAFEGISTWWDGRIYNNLKGRHDGVLGELRAVYQRMERLRAQLDQVADGEEETVRRKEAATI